MQLLLALGKLCQLILFTSCKKRLNCTLMCVYFCLIICTHRYIHAHIISGWSFLRWGSSLADYDHLLCKERNQRPKCILFLLYLLENICLGQRFQIYLSSICEVCKELLSAQKHNKICVKRCPHAVLPLRYVVKSRFSYV